MNGSRSLRDLSESIFSLTVQSANDGMIAISSTRINKCRMKVNFFIRICRLFYLFTINANVHAYEQWRVSGRWLVQVHGY